MNTKLDKGISRYLYTILIFLVCLSLGTLAACSVLAPEEEAAPGGITGRVYLDEDADRECDICDCDFYLDGIEIRLFRDRCAGLEIQTVDTDEEGIFYFGELEPGPYCVSPRVKLLCEGYQPTTSITQKVEVKPGEVVEAPWFGFDHHLDMNE